MSKSLGNVIDPVHVIEGMPLQNLLENVLVRVNASNDYLS